MQSKLDVTEPLWMGGILALLLADRLLMRFVKDPAAWMLAGLADPPPPRRRSRSGLVFAGRKARRFCSCSTPISIFQYAIARLVRPRGGHGLGRGADRAALDRHRAPGPTRPTFADERAPLPLDLRVARSWWFGLT